jgi:hypothetical protein
VNHGAEHACRSLPVTGKLDDKGRSKCEFGFADKAAAAGRNIAHLNRHSTFRDDFAGAKNHRAAAMLNTGGAAVLVNGINLIPPKGIYNFRERFR